MSWEPPAHPARNVTVVNTVPVDNPDGERLEIESDQIALMCELLHQLIDQAKLTNAILGEIAK